MKQERRRFKRIFFSEKDSVEAIFILPDEPTQQFKGNIMNMSEGGLFISVTKDTKNDHFAEGVHLILKDINGTKPELNVEDTEVEVKWLLQVKFLDSLGLGCEFINIAEPAKKQIRDLITSFEQQSSVNK